MGSSGNEAGDGAEGRHAEATALAVEALTEARGLDHAAWLGWALLLLGAERLSTGNHEAAATLLLEESVATFRTFGGRWGEADALILLARAMRDRGDLAEAARRYAEALAVRGDIGAAVGVDNSLLGLADVVLTLGFPDAAIRFVGATEAHHELMGFEPFRDTLREHSQLYDRLRTSVEPEAFARLLAEGRALSAGDVIAEAVVFAAGLSQPAS